MSSTSVISQFANNHPWITFGIVCSGFSTINHCVDAIFRRRDEKPTVCNILDAFGTLSANNANIKWAFQNDNKMSPKLKNAIEKYFQASEDVESTIFEERIIKMPS